jgi:GTP-binding protein
MFIDKVKIYIKSGDGGAGAVSFFRAKYIQKGGPDGGDGGRGGSVIFAADGSLNSLSNFRYQKSFKAQNGEPGAKQNCAGKSGEDLYIKVPRGTIIRDFATGKIICDIAGKSKATILKGGRGGRGNQRFATSKMQAPRYAQPGEKGAELEVVLELKVIADVGIIGLPNAGKSTLLSMVTNANPKIDSYRFTTLSPNLGVVKMDGGFEFVMADIPGLVEGAAEGVGLGFDFLRHIERVKVLLHVVDCSGQDGSDPRENIEIITRELEKYNKDLLNRPKVIAANKMDLPESAAGLARLDRENVFPISAATKQGLGELIAAVAKLVEESPAETVFEPEYVFEDRQEEEIIIEKTRDGYEVSGKSVEKMMGYTNLDTQKGFNFFQKYMVEKGVIERLKSAGMKEGDSVKVADFTFEYYD